MKRLITRRGERRCGVSAYKGKDRRRANYDRRKLSEPQGLKPPMSDPKVWDQRASPRHMPGYVADVAATAAGHRRASSVEASRRYTAARRGRERQLLVGLTVDAEIN